MLDQQSYEAEQRRWLAEQFDAIPSEVKVLRPSEWAEQHRYLPPSVTPMPGPYRFDVAPYLREPLDCLAVDSPIRSLAFMKGAQICATVGILENFLGYLIEHVRTSPVMLVTADAELAQLRVEANILPMLQASGLAHLIKSSDEGNSRKTGKTEKKLEWDGGGYLVPLGAQNANKMRSISVENLLEDERDAWPTVVGKDGDPGKLVVDRTAAYEQSRKIVEVSTPLIHGQSPIADSFERGDQRRYFVCCLACGFAQVLRWRHVNSETGVVSGIVWEHDGARLVPGSVRYLCQQCQHPHTNDDKTRLLSPDNGAEWRPTAQAASPHHRSYHLNALYSPVGMQSWETCVEKWLEAWDVENERPRDLAKLQVFYNNVLGETFELRGEKVRLDAVSSHRRAAYKFGQVPNEFAKQHCLSPILLVTAAVDVHADQLPYAVFGWCRDRRAFLLDYRRLEGDTDSLDDPGTWGALREELTHRTFVADDGKRYRIQMAMVDSGYRTDHVYRFAADLDGVFPVKGREQPTKNVLDREIHLSVSATGSRTLLVTVDRYKDRLSSALRREWDGFGVQPHGHFNAPADVTEKQLKELTVETKVAKPGKLGGYEWRRPSGAANELWDLYVYNSAALDLVALDVCKNQLGLEGIDWPTFWDVCERQAPYFEAA
jgi:phage terminase large subunit GpA-like protein